MVKIDNDETKNTARPFLIIAQKRSGGTYLTHCLSNHPQIHCDRGESMHHMSLWRKYLEPRELLMALTNQAGYYASGFRMVYSQAFNKTVWDIVTTIIKPHIIWLTRENTLRCGVSIAVNDLIRRGALPYYPVHTFENNAPPRLTVKPKSILNSCRKVVQNDRVAGKRMALSGLAYMDIQYAELTGGEGQTRRCLTDGATNKLCAFLGVEPSFMCSDLKRVHSHPLRAMFENWSEIEPAVQDSEFAKFLKEEQAWEHREGQWQIIAR